MALSSSKAIRLINERGLLLVFPIQNRPDPRSLWFEFHPKTAMRWEWDGDADHKVSDMWMLMKKLSDSREVVYSKWFRGRATFFSRDLFTAMLAILLQSADPRIRLSPVSRQLLETLESDSPLSTKVLKRLTELQGRDNEGVYQRGLKSLFSRFLIIAYGEVDDGAFPSLAVGATELLYEELWRDATNMKKSAAQKTVDRFLPVGSLTRKFFDQVLKDLIQDEALENER